MAEDGIRSLDLPISDEEVKTAFWSLKPFKAPGPDGLHARFYHRFWLIIGNSIKEEVRKVFTSGDTA